MRCVERRERTRAARGDLAPAPRAGRCRTRQGGDMTEPLADKWPRESQFLIVERYHSAIRAIVAERFAASGKTWEEVVHDPAFEFKREDFEQLEADRLATDHRFDVSTI